MQVPTIELIRKTFLPSAVVAVLGPPIIWAIHLQTAYSLVVVAQRTQHYGPMYATTAVCLVLSLLFGLLAWRDWRKIRDDPANGQSDTPPGRTRFLSLIGMVNGVFFAIVILATGLATFFFKAEWQ